MQFDGYTCYKLFTALKVHFTDDTYDFFKYNGALRASRESYDKRKDQKQFEKLAKKAGRVNFLDYIVASLLNDRIWAADLVQNEDDADSAYTEYRRVLESLSYTFSEELDYMISKVDKPMDILVFRDNDTYPFVIYEFLNGNISVQTLTILNKQFRIFDRYHDKLKDDYLWTRARFKVNKYTPFLDHKMTDASQLKVKKIMKTKLL